MKTTILTALLVMGAASLPAAAQTTVVAPVPAEVPQNIRVATVDRNVMVQPFGRTAGQLADTPLVDGKGTRMGNIERVIGSSRTPQALVVHAEGTDRRVILPLQRFKRVDGALLMDITATDFSKFPPYTAG